MFVWKTADLLLEKNHVHPIDIQAVLEALIRESANSQHGEKQVGVMKNLQQQLNEQECNNNFWL